jgi:hypothetical protein
MLQASIQNVSSVSNICCKCVYMDVVVVIHIYCKRMFVNISLSSYILQKCFHVATLAGVRSERVRSGPYLHAYQQARGRHQQAGGGHQQT